MKKHNFYIFILLFIITSFNAQANIYRINSSLITDASQKLYKTINEAVAVATAGDTLMIEGSSTVYDGATIDKPLILIGPGYFLAENPQTQANTSTAIVGNITVASTAGGTVLQGLTFSTEFNNIAPVLETNNVIITRCHLHGAVMFNVSGLTNIQITENYCDAGVINLSFSDYSFTNVSLKNNFINSSVSQTGSGDAQKTFSSVENNIFNNDVVLTATTFRSNILTSSSATVTISSTNIQNNLSAGTPLIGTGNITYNPAQLFVGATGNSTDGQYKLQPTYLTAGYEGTQPGIYGGTEPYVLSGIPPVPSIYELDANDAANKQTGLPVEIKVKANQ